MPWYLSDAAVGAAVAVAAVLVTVMLFYRQQYEGQRVELDPARTRTIINGNAPRRAVLSLLSRGNRATVIRDIRLVDKAGGTVRSYRLDGGCEPRPPFRLDAPDEREATIEIAAPDEQRLDHIEVDYLGGTKPIEWPYVQLQAAVTAGASADATFVPGPPTTDAARTPAHPAPKEASPGSSAGTRR